MVINYKKSTLDNDGVASIFGEVDGIEFQYNVHFGLGITNVAMGSLTEYERVSIANEFQNSDMFKKILG
ncbi:hypothetical protein Q7A53_05855 [Halobacillus rhizosphaerae]|uniref:hypothetical protein n=1 Tax=Halobacillus rhizosphaerae TaxID=3064889 RepID=UPI00398B103F